MASAAGEDLRKIPGVGKAISDKVQELLTTGRVVAYDRLAEELPAVFWTCWKFRAWVPRP